MNNSEQQNSTTDIEASASENVLNERQMKILEEMGLSTDYEELTLSQKMAIVAIEEMLQATEEKYGEEFAYAGYVAKGILEDEQLYAYSVANGSPSETFIVTRERVDGEYVYTDGYMNVAVKRAFMKYLDVLIDAEIGNASKKIYGSLSNVSLSEIPSDNKEFDGNLNYDIQIFLDLDSDEVSKDDFNVYAAKIERSLKAHDLYGHFQLILLKDDCFDLVTEENHRDYNTQDFLTEWVWVHVLK